MELDRILESLEPQAARTLETRVREAISAVIESNAPLPTLEEMKCRMPEFADLIGCWKDVEFDLPPELPHSPAKTW